MNWKEFKQLKLEIAPAPTAPSNQPMQQPGTIQQGQQQLPPGTEQEDWYKQLQKSGMPPEWQSYFVQQQLNAPQQSQGIGGMMKQAGKAAMGKMMGTSILPAQGM